MYLFCSDKLVNAIQWDQPVSVPVPKRGYIDRGLSYIGLGGGSGKPEASIEEDNSPVFQAVDEENNVDTAATPAPAIGNSSVNTPATRGMFVLKYFPWIANPSQYLYSCSDNNFLFAIFRKEEEEELPCS